METQSEKNGPTVGGRYVDQFFTWFWGFSHRDWVFEFESGYRYSAYWFALAGPAEIPTDVDEVVLGPGW